MDRLSSLPTVSASSTHHPCEWQLNQLKQLLIKLGHGASCEPPFTEVPLKPNGTNVTSYVTDARASKLISSTD